MKKATVVKLTAVLLLISVLSQICTFIAFAEDTKKSDSKYFRDILEEADKSVGWFLSENPFEYEYDSDDFIKIDFEYATEEGRTAKRSETYYKVTGGFNSFDEFYNYMRRHLPDNLVYNLFYSGHDTGTAVFIEHSGALYFNEGRASTHLYNINKDTESYELKEQNDRSAVLRYYPAEDREKHYDYVFHLKDDGEYEITNYIPTSSMYYGNEDLFISRYRKDNPQTSDTPVIAVCALALSALAAAVVLRKKRG